ncbi:hypothetical protein DMA11_21100 [Marinilabiliaceae bacterium JC017]|nr:hypothetical protein DMA11_21100 [Marinilabiliaceae bacterium JC017]
MKGIKIAALLILMTKLAYTQNNQVENTHNIKATFLGISYAYEQSISQKITINFELMLADEYGENLLDGLYWRFSPYIRIEPRYYYNITKRSENGKNTTNNSANYISLSADYQPIERIGESTSLHGLSIIPKYGLKRSINEHFTFELAAGIGAYTSEVDTWESTWGADIKIGYSF